MESPSRPIGFALAAAERTVKAESARARSRRSSSWRDPATSNRRRRRCAFARQGTRGCTDSPRERETSRTRLMPSGWLCRVGLSRWGFVLLSGILVRGLVGIIRAFGCERGRNQSLGKERL